MIQKVHVLAVSDTHGDLEQLDLSREDGKGDVDIVIVAGDVGPGATKHGAMSNDWARSNHLASWFKSHSATRFYILPGNHDLFALTHARREKARSIWPKNVHLMNNKGYLDETGVTIWGMPLNPIHYHDNGVPHSTKGGAFAADSKEIEEACKKILRSSFKDLDILVTHAPPQAPNTVFSARKWHRSLMLSNLLPDINPRLLICGHDHKCSHVPQKPGTINGRPCRTEIVNVAMKHSHSGPFVYKPRRIVIEVERNIKFDMDRTSEMYVKTATLDHKDKAKLTEMCIAIEKVVRGVNKRIDEKKGHEIPTRHTGKKFKKEVDINFLQRVAPLDETGKAKKLIKVVKLLQASEANGWKDQVLPELIQKNAVCYVYKLEGKKRYYNIDFTEYRYGY